MATRGETNLTLSDWAKRLDGSGRVSQEITVNFFPAFLAL